MLLGIRNHMGNSTPLMVTREHQRTLSLHNPELVCELRLFAENEIVEQPQPGILLSEFLPEEGHGIGVRLGGLGIPGVSVTALVKRQETRLVAVKLGCHLNVRFANGEMDNSPAFSLQQRAFSCTGTGLRLTFRLVFFYGFVDILREVRFNFGGCHGDAVDEENKVKRLTTVVRSEVNLLHHAQNVFAITCLNIFVALILGLAFAHAECPEPNQCRFVTEKPQRSLGFEGGYQVV